MADRDESVEQKGDVVVCVGEVVEGSGDEAGVLDNDCWVGVLVEIGFIEEWGLVWGRRRKVETGRERMVQKKRMQKEGEAAGWVHASFTTTFSSSE